MEVGKNVCLEITLCVYAESQTLGTVFSQVHKIIKLDVYERGYNVFYRKSDSSQCFVCFLLSSMLRAISRIYCRWPLFLRLILTIKCVHEKAKIYIFRILHHTLKLFVAR